jgi:hypothetical protein
VQIDVTAERVARNQSTFRDANEHIEKRAAELLGDSSSIPFICECPEPTCTSIAKLSLVEYEMVRSHGEWFLAIPGHETCLVDGEHVARVERRYANFSLMEKIGRARDAARELDPRE